MFRYPDAVDCRPDIQVGISSEASEAYVKQVNSLNTNPLTTCPQEIGLWFMGRVESSFGTQEFIIFTIAALRVFAIKGGRVLPEHVHLIDLGRKLSKADEEAIATARREIDDMIARMEGEKRARLARLQGSPRCGQTLFSASPTSP
jgi:hypothetical protein